MEAARVPKNRLFKEKNTVKNIKQIKTICKKLGITLVDIAQYKDQSKFGDGNNYNKSFIIGHDEIWLGVYKDERFKLISFFHELGHKFLPKDYAKRSKYNTLMIELKAWELGLEYALNKGFIFDDDVIKWGYEQALSYVGHDKREYRNKPL
jgi:hypothetical protein